MAVASLFVLFLMLIGLATVPVGIILIVKSRGARLQFPSCGGCGYDLTGNTATTDICPECGGKFVKVGINPPRPGRRPALLWIGIALLLLPMLTFGLMVVGLTTARQTRMQAVIAQQQAQVQIMAQQRAQLATQLATLTEELSAATDEEVKRELEEALAVVRQRLDAADSELEPVTDAPVIADGDDEPDQPDP